MSGNETPMRGHIQINNVSKIYDPDGAKVLAVDRCTMDIAPGEFCVVVGPSGCGKTTLTRLINGLIPHYYTGKLDGKVLLDGKELKDYPLYQIGQRVGSVFQNPPTSRRSPAPTASWSSRTARCSRGSPCLRTSPSGPSSRRP